MNLSKSFLAIIFSLVSLALTAQEGIIRGSVIDESGEMMIMVTVAAEGTTTGAFTDLDGKFNLAIAPGTYNLNLSFVGYEGLSIKDVIVKEGEVTLLESIVLKPSTVALDEVTVTATMRKSTENALLSLKMRSATVMDGISAGSFKKDGGF